MFVSLCFYQCSLYFQECNSTPTGTAWADEKEPQNMTIASKTEASIMEDFIVQGMGLLISEGVGGCMCMKVIGISLVPVIDLFILSTVLRIAIFNVDQAGPTVNVEGFRHVDWCAWP